jgi:GTPase SAR1 family protein
MTDTATVLHEYASQLADIARSLGLPRLGDTILAETDRRLDRAQLRVLVLGEIKQGKSTLINALLGESTLPAGVTPTTGAVVQIVRGDELGRFLVGPDGARTSLDPERFARLARGKEATAGSLLVTTASPHLPAGVELIDTPGINDLQRLRSLIARGELPRGDVLVLVLDATQVLKLTEVAFLRDALTAVGGTEGTGAALLLAINRIDLVPEAERPALVDHIHRELTAVLPGAVELFQTDARGAGKQPDGASLGVREVGRLRARLHELAGKSTVVLPTRTRASLQRYADLLAHHAAVEARALRLERAALQAELTAVREALVQQRLDLEKIDVTLAEGRARLVAESQTRLANFRGELLASILAQLDRSDLRATADLLPGAIQDAVLHFTYQEVERMRLALEQLTRDAIHTCGEQAQRRLAETLLNLGFRGPAVHLKPTSVGIEAGTLAVGIAGTAIMYFGNIVAGLVVTIAAPLATMVLRERSIRELRAAARESVPHALASSFAQLEQALARAVDGHIAGLKEYLVLAHNQLGGQLQALLERAAEISAAAALPSDLSSGTAARPAGANPSGAAKPDLSSGTGARPTGANPSGAAKPDLSSGTASTEPAAKPDLSSGTDAGDPRRAALAELRLLEQRLDQLRARLAELAAAESAPA